MRCGREPHAGERTRSGSALLREQAVGTAGRDPGTLLALRRECCLVGEAQNMTITYKSKQRELCEFKGLASQSN